MLEDGFGSNYIAVVLSCRSMCEKLAKNTVMAKNPVIPSIARKATCCNPVVGDE